MTKSNSRFSYLVDKIANAVPLSKPFDFVFINDFLKVDDFEEIMKLKEVNVRGNDFNELKDNLSKLNYRHQRHPGTFERIEKYEKWRATKSYSVKEVQGTQGVKLVEAGGCAYRLHDEPRIIRDLVDVFKSKEMENVVREKFDLLPESVDIDCGLHKYLHGYEISPHPDNREKALTWMLNLNTCPDSHNEDYHTHFLKFKESYEYIVSIWGSIPSLQTHWVPWDWCETIFQQRENNSISIFSPRNNSLHAVKAFYDDLEHQRTQIYGNYWYKTPKASMTECSYLDLDIKANISAKQIKYDSTWGKILRAAKHKSKLRKMEQWIQQNFNGN